MLHGLIAMINIPPFPNEDANQYMKMAKNTLSGGASFNGGRWTGRVVDNCADIIYRCAVECNCVRCLLTM